MKTKKVSGAFLLTAAAAVSAEIVILMINDFYVDILFAGISFICIALMLFMVVRHEDHEPIYTSCKKCGQKYEAAFNYCPHCGKKQVSDSINTTDELTQSALKAYEADNSVSNDEIEGSFDDGADKSKTSSKNFEMPDNDETDELEGF